VRLRTRIIAHPIITAILVLAFAGVATAAVPVFQATEAPSFCTTCHEMQPYYDAWSVGAHKGISCVECHVDAGAANHVAHKITAAKELWIHLSGDPRFPQGTAVVPDSRCLACHADIMSTTGPKFSHKQHAGSGPCVQCHSDAGHRVALDALAKAGVLQPGLETSGAAVAVRAARSSASTIATHSPVSCSKCHDLTKLECASCHQPDHEPRGACETCHQPGPRWSFSHPTSAECASCHDAPVPHFGSACETCHSPDVPFADTAYRHSSTDCAKCHTAPAKHRPGACKDCHKKPGVEWTFAHPVKAACGTCHSASAGHYRAVSCASCHRRPGVSWAATHPSSASCASCHRAPSGHVRTVSCATCHKKPGTSWAARHPASTACATCHKAPASHFGTSCASCHKPLVAWSRATFRHPSTGGEHTYRSFACVKCHPNGYGSSYCSCHKGNPPHGD